MIKKRYPLLAAALLLAACTAEQPADNRAVPQTVAPLPPSAALPFDPNAAPVSQVGFNGNDNVQRFIAREAENGRYSRADLQAFAPNVVVEISDWRQFRGSAYHAKTGRSRTIAESRIEPLEAVAAYRFSNGLLTLQGFALPPSEEWLEYGFVQPVVRITQRPSEKRKP